MTLLQEVYSTWVANGRCSSYQLLVSRKPGADRDKITWGAAIAISRMQATAIDNFKIPTAP